MSAAVREIPRNIGGGIPAVEAMPTENMQDQRTYYVFSPGETINIDHLRFGGTREIGKCQITMLSPFVDHHHDYSAGQILVLGELNAGDPRGYEAIHEPIWPVDQVRQLMLSYGVHASNGDQGIIVLDALTGEPGSLALAMDKLLLPDFQMPLLRLKEFLHTVAPNNIENEKKFGLSGRELTIALRTLEQMQIACDIAINFQTAYTSQTRSELSLKLAGVAPGKAYVDARDKRYFAELEQDAPSDLLTSVAKAPVQDMSWVQQLLERFAPSTNADAKVLALEEKVASLLAKHEEMMAVITEPAPIKPTTRKPKEATPESTDVNAGSN